MSRIIDLFRRRWRITVLGGLILVVAGLWAVFPSLLGSAPDALDPEEARIGAVSCENCPFFDLDSLELPGDHDASFSLADFQQAIDDGVSPTWVWAVPAGEAPAIAFTVGNASADTRILLTGIELEVRDHQPVPEALALGCVPPEGGVPSIDESVEAIGFSVAVSPDLVGATRAVSVDEGADQVTIQPSGLERYEGDMRLSEPGVYTLGVKAAYDSSEGVTSSASSAEIHVMRIDDATDISMIPADQTPVCQSVTFPAAGPPNQLTEVTVDESSVSFLYADRAPAVRVERLERPVRQQPSGRELEIRGSGLLAVTMAPASGVDLSGTQEPTYEGPNRITPDNSAISELLMSEDAEGMMTWVIGTTEADPGFGFETVGRTVSIRVDG